MIDPESGMPFQTDRVLGVGAPRVIADFNQFSSKERLQRAAIKDERLRLARELHDGVLQALTGAVLQLKALSELIETDPEAVRNRLRGIEELIAEEQSELRAWIDQNLRPPGSPSMALNVGLAAALDKLCKRVAWQWGLRIELTMGDDRMITTALGEEVYRLVQEAISNVVRHARAAVAHIKVEIGSETVHVTVSDDGCGFPFRGRFDLAALMARHLGPASLKERISSLRGELIVTSTLSGSHLDISLPLQPRPRRRKPPDPTAA